MNYVYTAVPAMALEMEQQLKQNSGIIQLDELCCAIILMGNTSWVAKLSV